MGKNERYEEAFDRRKKDSGECSETSVTNPPTGKELVVFPETENILFLLPKKKQKKKNLSAPEDQSCMENSQILQL